MLLILAGAVASCCDSRFACRLTGTALLPDLDLDDLHVVGRPCGQGLLR